MFTPNEAHTLLKEAGLFFGCHEEDTDPKWDRMLNLSDTWGWACADGELVPEEELPRLADLFWRYGYCGVLYWVSQRRDGCRSEFADINRFVDFVKNEEAIRAEEPSDDKRAYLNRVYTLGQ